MNVEVPKASIQPNIPAEQAAEALGASIQPNLSAEQAAEASKTFIKLSEISYILSRKNNPPLQVEGRKI